MVSGRIAPLRRHEEIPSWESTDIFWHEFYKGAGITLGLLLPLLLGFGAVMLGVFRQLHRHEEAMQ